MAVVFKAQIATEMQQKTKKTSKTKHISDY